MKKTSHHLHDRTFRAAMSDLRVAKDFFQHYLPAQVLAKVDLESLSICKESYVDQELQNLTVDILYKVNWQQQNIKHIEKGYLYICAEHQSTPDRLMP